ncbi:ribosomal maturation YjgA family protein [Altibacter sp. HG106]|uniref:ribosomal maturation YjgA family protein n=1 Tax=Altibacter sp. HG106 TaxID=3023937 RepID=UPI00235073C9|nr:DUF2809 domain-containing protein [Altibacter sp. HG106]MDC7996150.1 DUF2809 domain-containing protein [Altibacter sp. HG106]
MKRNVYGVAFLCLLFIEVGIAMFASHGIIRGFIGDVLVIPLLYCFLQILFKGPVIRWALVALIIGFIVEYLQLVNILLPWISTHPVLKIVLGSVFDVYDLLAYSIGFVWILIMEFRFGRFHRDPRNKP